MLRITENKDEIILRDIPLIRWIISIVIAVFWFLIVFADFSFNKKTLLDWTAGPALIVTFAGFIVYLVTFPATTTKIDKKGETISVRKQSLIKYSFNVYSFNELTNPIFVKEFIFWRNTGYQLILSLKDDSQIELSVSAGLYKEPLQKTANLLNIRIFDI